MLSVPLGQASRSRNPFLHMPICDSVRPARQWRQGWSSLDSVPSRERVGVGPTWRVGWVACLLWVACLKDLNGNVDSSFVPLVIEGIVVTSGHHRMVDNHS